MEGEHAKKKNKYRQSQKKGFTFLMIHCRGLKPEMYNFQLLSLSLTSFSKLDNEDQKAKKWREVSLCGNASV